jgi:opacity protein-like surface antigen
MRIIRLHPAVIFMLGLAVSGTVAMAQSVPGVDSLGKTDVALSLYGAFSQKTTANGVTVSPSNAAGGMVELRHLANPIFGFEGTYSYNRSNQTYTSDVAVTCPIGVSPCPVNSTSVKANAHEVTLDWVPSVSFANVRPFGVLGVGVLLNVPSGGQSNTQTSTKPVYVYGAGLDWGLLPHLGLRLQYRGNLYSAPDVTRLYTSIDKFKQTAEPMIGVYLRL